MAFNFSLVAFAIFTALASLCLLIRNPIPFTPFKRQIVDLSISESSTSATSFKRTEEELDEKMIRFSNSSIETNFPERRTVN